MVALCEAACKYVHNVKCWRLAGVTTFTFSSFTHTFHTNNCTDRRWHNIVNLKLLYAMCVTRKTVIFTSATSSSLRFSIFRHQSASAWVADGQRQANSHCMCRTVQHNFGCADLQTYSRGWRKCPKLKYWTNGNCYITKALHEKMIRFPIHPEEDMNVYKMSCCSVQRFTKILMVALKEKPLGFIIW